MHGFRHEYVPVALSDISMLRKETHSKLFADGAIKNQCLMKIGINPEPLFLFVSAIYQMDLTQVLLPII
jgi:hypothetical protein